jgi:hypothetical protein
MASSPRLLPDLHRISTSRGKGARAAAALAADVAASAGDASVKGSAKWALGGIIGGSAAAGLLAGGSSALAVDFSRRVISPSRVGDWI